MRQLPYWNNLRLSHREAIFGYLFIFPWLLGFLALRFGPMLASLFLSFTEYDILSAPEFIGVTNYVKMFTEDPSFWDSLRVTLTYAIFSVPIGLALSLAIALLAEPKCPWHRPLAHHLLSTIGGLWCSSRHVMGVALSFAIWSLQSST